ncbi:metallophosphoesterase [Spirochaeta cellobiosiphila]|uniref:metallophosphoesterase n=1 Tax=Spirochaeta cellobiosiphila TaxID=504483 RepID=UPI0003F91DDA|nr:metallophosphoesterase [Spirochaeta cellobiosiphila]
MSESLPKRGSMAMLDKVLELRKALPAKVRPRTAENKPGALIDFRGIAKEYFIVGDLHANLHNFKCILETDDIENKLDQDKAILILVGDVIHDDRTGYLTEMEPSLELLELVLECMVRWPQNFIFLQGNHDTFNHLLVKSGIKQAKYFDEFLVAHRGEEYRNKVEELFNTLPLFIMADAFLCVHAGPVRGGCTRDHLIEIRRYETDAFQLMWNRINTIGSLANNKEYTEDDINKTKELLGVDPDIYFIVGHNPLYNLGGDESVWFNIMGAKNYIIIYSSVQETCPIIKFSKNSYEHELIHVDLKIQKSRFFLGDIY